MTESITPRWPQEAFQPRNEAYEYQTREIERAVLLLKDAFWREEAVSRACAILKAASGEEGLDHELDVERLTSAIRKAELIPPVDAESLMPNSSLDLLSDIIIGEATAIFLCQKTDPIAWKITAGILSQLHSAHQSFKENLSSIYKENKDFRDRFNSLAEILFDAFINDPISQAPGRGENLAYALDEWIKNPELRKIWFGLRELRDSYLYPSTLDFLLELYISIDVKNAARLLDKFGNPYQVWVILNNFGGRRLSDNFAAWSELFRHSASSFAADGSWNGKSLEPLLLLTAQDALSGALLPKNALSDLLTARQAQFASVTSAISRLIAQKPNGGSLALRWGAWLFRLCAVGTSEQEPFPVDLRQRITPFWFMLEALAQSDAAATWNNIEAHDAIPEEVLCILAVKTIAAHERNLNYPSIDSLMRCLPHSPEDFLGEGGRATRELARLFSLYGKRPDSLQFRVLSLLVLQGDPVEIYGNIWRRTLTLRELAEHWQAGDRDDGRMEAKDTLAMIVAIGLCALDYYVDPNVFTKAKTLRDPQKFAELFKLVYDALRELQSIELFSQNYWADFYKHLLVRRALYEDSHLRETKLLTSLAPDSCPTFARMIERIAGVTELFFDGLSALDRNGISRERIIMAIERAGVNLAELIRSAQKLNGIDERRSYRIEVAEKLLAGMKH